MGKPIHTLNARGNLMLEVVRDYFRLNNRVMRREIHGMRNATEQILWKKGIAYVDLKSALVPSAERNEAGFIFESGKGWYGRAIADAILPLLDRATTQSYLFGDLGGENEHQQMIFKILEGHLVLARSLIFTHSSALSCAYINNLSEAALHRLHAGLSHLPWYVGYLPSTFSSAAKAYLSVSSLGVVFVKNGSRVVMGHEDDRSNDEDVNLPGYPF